MIIVFDYLFAFLDRSEQGCNLLLVLVDFISLFLSNILDRCDFFVEGLNGSALFLNQLFLLDANDIL